MQEVKITTVPVDEAMNFWREQIKIAKTELLSEMITQLGSVNWNLYGSLLTRKEAAKLFGRSVECIDTWVAQGTLKGTYVKNKLVGIQKENVMKVYYGKR